MLFDDSCNKDGCLLVTQWDFVPAVAALLPLWWRVEQMFLLETVKVDTDSQSLFFASGCVARASLLGVYTTCCCCGGFSGHRVLPPSGPWRNARHVGDPRQPLSLLKEPRLIWVVVATRAAGNNVLMNNPDHWRRLLPLRESFSDVRAEAAGYGSDRL